MPFFEQAVQKFVQEHEFWNDPEFKYDLTYVAMIVKTLAPSRVYVQKDCDLTVQYKTHEGFEVNFTEHQEEDKMLTDDDLERYARFIYRELSYYDESENRWKQHD